jgi:hypothetical protein
LGETAATVENLYDHNRDTTVDSADKDLVKANLNKRLILLIAP